MEQESLSLAHGLLEGAFIPETSTLICSDGTVLPATASPVLLRWFEQHPDEAAKAKLWRVYPRTTREGLAVYVIGAESAATAADALRLRRGIDRFKISGVVVNQKTERSKVGATVVVRISRNRERPAGQTYRHPNWKPRLIWLRGGLRPTSKYKGQFAHLMAKRSGKELRLVGVRASGERPQTPIVFELPAMQWPWPFRDKTADVAAWCKSWWDHDRDRFVAGTFQRVPLLVSQGLCSSNRKSPPFLVQDVGAEVQDMLERLERFTTIQKLLVQRFLLPALKKLAADNRPGVLGRITGKDKTLPDYTLAISKLQTETDRVRLVAQRLRKLVERMDSSTQEELLTNTGVHLMLKEMLVGFEHAVFRFGHSKSTGDRMVIYQGVPVSGCRIDQEIGVKITGKLAQMLLDKLPARHNEKQLTSAPTPAKEYEMPSSYLDVGQMILDGHRDATILSKFKLWPGQLNDVATRLVESGWAADHGMDPKEEKEITNLASSTMRQALRRRMRAQLGLTGTGRPVTKREPV